MKVKSGNEDQSITFQKEDKTEKPCSLQGCAWAFSNDKELHFIFDQWLPDTVPNNSYRFWADLLHKWSFMGMTDIHEYWSK